MAEIKFYSDAAKQHQVYPEINPYGNYPGVTVGLADNLVSTDGQTEEDAFLYRSSAGSASIGSGYAEIVSIKGNNGGESGTPGSIPIIATKPIKIETVGLNLFNKNGEDILSNKTIDNTGAIVSQTGTSVIWIPCLADNTYTVYNSVASSIGNAGYVASMNSSVESVTLTSPVTTATSPNGNIDVENNNKCKHFTPTANGFLVIASTNLNTLCCHLTWSGTKDDVFEDYWTDSVDINYPNDIFPNGLYKINSSIYDEINYKDKKAYKRIGVVNYSLDQLNELIAEASPRTLNYICDENIICYDLETPIEYDLGDITPIYQVDDYGTEKITYQAGYSTAPLVKIFYQNNLKDKLRTENFNNIKCNSITINNTTVAFNTVRTWSD